jgi:hypothetical protein
VSRVRVPVLAVLASALLVGCGGPRPAIERVEGIPQTEGRVRVVVTLQNRSGGDGQVAVTVTLRDRASHAVVGRQEWPVDLHPRERVTLAVDMVAGGPPGAEITAEAVARYPPG